MRKRYLYGRLEPDSASRARTYLYAFLARIARHISRNRCRAHMRLKRYAVICELTTELEQCIPKPDDTRMPDISVVTPEWLHEELMGKE